MSFKKYFIGRQANSFKNAVTLLALPKNAQLIRMEQVHGNKIVEIFDSSLNFEALSPLSGIDACYTTKKNTFLSVKSADCLPILISGFGTKNKTGIADEAESFPFIAVAHAGRKSTETKILFNLLEELNNRYDFVTSLKEKNKTLDIWFGPAICESCYQINQETDIHYNLNAKNEQQVTEFFVKYDLDPELSLNLEIENHCTLHEPEKYYSYRATGPGVQMNYSFIGIE
ncbi:polyphenol oxidase family protein [Candidatus Woesebacteria bacterium]|nr:polyphenol oxidase family protein [Candidatus Woesebacteria bacterium]